MTYRYDLALSVASGAPALMWSEGEIAVDLAGWVEHQPRSQAPDLHARFHAVLSADAAAQLAPWFAPPPGLALSAAAAVSMGVTPGP